MDIVVPEIQCKAYCLLQRTARVRGHEIGNEILFLSDALCYFIKTLLKAVVGFDVGLAHFVKDCIAAVFRCNFKLTAYVFLYKLLEKAVVLILKQIVKANAASYKYTLYLRKGSQFPEHGKIFRVVCFKSRAGRWR